ncbi:MAG: hypothetical protein JKY24_02965 [Pseudomonadales bacterium]|nr:hypothetical protein [Pseudomonadales bacterium]
MVLFKYIFIFLLGYLLASCSVFEPLAGESPVRENFIALDIDDRILYKKGAKTNALLIAESLEKHIQKVESVHGEFFSKKVVVHICDTTACFNKYTGGNEGVSAAVGKNGLFLSPLAFRNDRQNLFLAHELSHLHLFQHISLFKTLFVPQWFHDGIATYASNGGGADFVPEAEAKTYIANNKYIIPIVKGGLMGNRWPINYERSTDFTFQQHMNYRQSAMFCEYLANGNMHQKLLREIENGEKFSSAFIGVYDATVEQVWNAFRRQI